MEKDADETRDIKEESLKALMAIRAWQDYTQGQVDALRVALFACFQVAQGNAELRTRVESELATRVLLMKKHPDPPQTIAGFESAMRDLVAGFQLGNSTDTAH
jgi:hypothetical protein